MSKWITDRMPTVEDCEFTHRCVYNEQGHVVDYLLIADGEPWKAIPKCEPYVRWPCKYVVEMHGRQWGVKRYSEIGQYKLEAFHAMNIPTREAAERIAAIYEEVMP